MLQRETSNVVTDAALRTYICIRFKYVSRLYELRWEPPAHLVCSSERIFPASQPACDVRSNAAHRHMAAARCCKRRETSRRLERRSSRPIGRLVGVLGDRGKRLRLTNTWHHSNAAGSPRQSGRTSASLNQERGSLTWQRTNERRREAAAGRRDGRDVTAHWAALW